MSVVPDSMPSVSAAVVSSRPEYIAHCLQSLENQTLPEEKMEILVIADYPRPDEIGGRVRWISEAPRSIAAKRNRALREARAPIIAFTDDDCTAVPDWVSAGLLYLAGHPAEIGVQGQTRVTKTEAPNAAETRRLENPRYQTCNIFYRSQKVLTFGGFDERFPYQREDADLAFTLLEQGETIGFEPKAVVYHAVRPKEHWDLIKTAYRKRYDPLLAKKHPVLFERVFGRILPGSFILMLLLTLGSVLLFGFGIGAIGFLPLPLSALFLSIRREREPGPQLLYSTIGYLVAPWIAFAVVMLGRIRYFTAR